MKKIAIISFLISVYSLSFSNEVLTLEKSIEILKQKSYIVEGNKINQEKLEVKEQDLKYGKWNDGFNLDSSYDNNENMSFGINYNIIDYNLNLKDSEVKGQSIGVSKNLKDFVYSQSQYDQKRLDFEKIQFDISKEKEINVEIINLIELYKNIINLKDELKINELTRDKMKKEIETLENKYKLGKISSLELEYSKIEYMKKENEIANSIKNIDSKKQDLKNILKMNNEIELSENNIKLSDEMDFEKVGSFDIKIKTMNKEEKEEEIKYSNIQMKPEVNLNLGRDIENKETTFGINFSWNGILKNKVQEKTDDLELEQIEMDTNELIKNNVLKIENYKKEYENLKQDVEYKLAYKDYVKKEFEITQKRYDMGKMNYFDYNEKSLKNEEAILGYKKAVNELNSFVLEIGYRK